MFAYFGRRQLAAHYIKIADLLAQSTYHYCFDVKRMEMANQPQKLKFSQHAGIMAILAGAVPSSEQKEVMKHILYDSSLSQCTLYYRFYLTRALVKSGLSDLYYSQLAPWRHMLKLGLTTFAEKPDPTRSDCHAWSASPEYDFLSTICGIMPAAPGFRRVRIEPALGPLKEAGGAMPAPQGMIVVHVRRTNQKDAIAVDVTLPQNLTGIFVWNGRQAPLHGGRQQFNFQ
jgi:hypothetical protein